MFEIKGQRSLINNYTLSGGSSPKSRVWQEDNLEPQVEVIVLSKPRLWNARFNMLSTHHCPVQRTESFTRFDHLSASCLLRLSSISSSSSTSSISAGTSRTSSWPPIPLSSSSPPTLILRLVEKSGGVGFVFGGEKELDAWPIAPSKRWRESIGPKQARGGEGSFRVGNDHEGIDHICGKESTSLS